MLKPTTTSGKDIATLDAFFDQFGFDRAAALDAMSIDMGASFNKSVRAEGESLTLPVPFPGAGETVV